MTSLDVYLNSTPAGRLSLERGRLVFGYEGSYLHDRDSVPLSRHCP